MAGHGVQSYALPVYSKINNQWPSLNVPRSELEKNLSEIRSTPWVEVKTEAPIVTSWMREADLLNATHVSKWAFMMNTARLKNFPNENSLPAKQMALSGPWIIHQHRDHWTQVSLPHRPEKYPEKYWVENSYLTAKGDDWEFAVTKRPTSLLSQADTTGKTLCQIKSQERLILHSFSGHFAKVQGCGGLGFVSLKDLITKAHFAKNVWTTDGTHEILRVNISEIIDINLRPISFSSIRGFEFHSGIRISKGQAAHSNQKLFIRRIKNVVWGLSQLPHAGKFWWNTAQKDSEPSPETTNQELLKRKLFDMVSSPKNPDEKWASAGGIYRTVNGKTWQKLAQFENNNYPIYISEKGRVLVGPYYSDDDGKTFSSYVRWDLLLDLLNQKSHAHLSDIRLSQIQPLDITGDALKLVFHVANQYLSIETKDFGASWQLMKK